MKDLKEYFQSQQDYDNFIKSCVDMLDNITIGGNALIECPVGKYGGGSAILRTAPYKSLPKTGYWFRISKMGHITFH